MHQSRGLPHGLEKDETLKHVGDYYWIDVLQNPGKDNHLNIRTFMKYGWDGIHFSKPAFTPLEPA
ncbi:MAG: HopJ type III effector protein [Methylococcaceae bacterium]|nr:HopJ type III effector protein [Methylococcaceae bacterium]